MMDTPLAEAALEAASAEEEELEENSRQLRITQLSNSQLFN